MWKPIFTPIFAALLFVAATLVFCQPSRAQSFQDSDGCYDFEDMVEYADKFGSELVLYAWDGSEEPDMMVVYVVIKGAPKVYIHLFHKGCMIPIFGKQFLPADYNETILTNIENSAIIFDSRKKAKGSES